VALVIAATVVAAEEFEAKPRAAKPLGSKKLKMVFPKVDTKLLRSSPNVVIVPKGDPRAYGPGKSVAPKPMLSQKAPKPKHNPPTPSKPVTPSKTAPPVIVVSSGAPSAQSSACSNQKGTCMPVTSCTTGYTISGICPGAANIKCCAPKPAPAGSCLSNFNGANLAARALQYQTAYAAHGVHYSQPSRQFGASPPVQYADCSSFVTSVLDSLGWDCLFANGRYTGAMIPIMQSRGGFHSTPKLGDIVMWTEHTGIIVGNCPAGQARMVAMGLSGARDTNCISITSLHGWGSGTFLGFWTPN